MRALVAGMHRSGTSAVMRALGAAGVDLGRQDQMMAASSTNPFGHFELMPIVDLNDELLGALGSHWAAPSHTADEMIALATPGAITDVASLLAGLEIGPNSVVKDPRFCLTLPFWQRAGFTNVGLVMPYRHPRSVAESLLRRNGLAVEYGYALWEWYHLSLLSAIVDRPIVPVAYHDLLHDTETTLRTLVGGLALDVTSQQLQQATDLIVAEAATTTYDPDDTADLPGSTRELWSMLQELTPGPVPDDFAVGLERPELFVGASQGIALEQHRAHELLQERDLARDALAESVTRIESERDVARSELAESIGRLESERDTARSELAESVVRLESERDEARAEFSGSIERLESERDTARSELAESIGRLESERDTARSELAESVVRLESERDEARAEFSGSINRLESERDEARSALQDTTLRLEGERDEARSRVDQLAVDLESGQRAALASAAVHGKRLARVEQQRDDAQHHASQLETERNDVAGHRDHVMREQAALTDRVHGLEQERDFFRAEFERYRRDADVIRNSRAGSLVYRWWDVRNRINDVIALPATLAARGRRLPQRILGRGSESIELVTTPMGELSAAPLLPEPVHFPESESPVVSIVVPVYGQLDYTARCLRSILDTPTAWAYEVIVVNDVSPDRTNEWLDSCSGITVVSNDINLGFLRSTNAGAAQARGSMILLLNNDTAVHDGWLDALVELLVSADDIGAVGAKLVYPDGVLQEAGGIIWNDGLGWNWGRGLDAEGYEFNFVREVDYCSAACLLVRRDLWEQLGGFDERYVPAYYEDTDLAFELRKLGFKVLYEPRSVVTHFEGISHGTDESSGLKAHQVENRTRFVDKWATELAHHHPSTGDPRLAFWRGEGPRVVIFDHEVPAPDQDSGSVRVTAMLDLLVEMGFRVTFIPHNRHRREPYATELAVRGIEVVYGHHDWHTLLASLAPDLGAVIICRPQVAMETLPVVTQAAPSVPIMYDMVDFHGLRIERRGEQTDTDELRHGQAIAEIEMAMVRATDVTIAVTDIEAELVQRKQPEAKVVVLPNIHRSARSTATFDERHGVMFVGAWRHIPNRDAIEFLCHEVMPLVWAQASDITLTLVGSDIPVEMWSGLDDRIEVLGWVPDLHALFEEVRCNVAPLRFGAGLKGKVGDSLIRGVPVVTTSIGAEGFGEVAESLLVGETAQELADHIVRLHADPQLWNELADRGYDGIVEHFGYDAARAALVKALETADVAIPRKPVLQ